MTGLWKQFNHQNAKIHFLCSFAFLQPCNHVPLMKIEDLLQDPYWIIDILPEQVPANSAGQYFAIEEYFLREAQAYGMRRKFANIILKLNCYYDIAVWEDFDADIEIAGAEGAVRPAPGDIVNLFAGTDAADYICLLVVGQNTVITSNRDETYLTIYNPTQKVADMLQRLAAAEGMFMWKANTDRVNTNEQAQGLTMYTGDEKLEYKGKELPYSMLRFWQLSLSDILLNINRGTFAEYIVRCALSEGGFDSLEEANGTIRPWDITGPYIDSVSRPARIEVKSTASIQLDTPDEREPLTLPDSKLVFSIKPAIDWAKEEGARHNNDLYVFCHYKAERKKQNILAMDLWDFYVYPTFMIEKNPSLNKKNSISLYRIKKLGVMPVSFDELYGEVIHQITFISDYLSQVKVQ